MDELTDNDRARQVEVEAEGEVHLQLCERTWIGKLDNFVVMKVRASVF